MMNPLNATNQVVWIVLAESKGARVLSVHGRNSPLELVKEWKNPEGRKLNGEIDTDRPGRCFSIRGSKHSFSQEVNSHEQKNKMFIHHIVAFLTLNHDENKFQHLVLVASPSLLGKLRGNFSDRMKHLVLKEIPKELPFQKPKREVEKYLRKALAIESLPL